MVPVIGIDVLHQGKRVHVQDVNNLALTANVGAPDLNGMIWDFETVSFDELAPL